MNIELKYFGSVCENGKLTIFNKKGFINELKYFNGKEVELTVRRKLKKRSNGQNRYFHGLAIPIIKHRLIELGFEEAFDNEWVKDFVKFNCLKIEIVNPSTGELMQTLGKTSNLNTIEFGEMVEKLVRWCAQDLEIELPYPNEKLTLNFYR